MKTTCLSSILLVSLFAAQAGATVMGINFGTGQQGGQPTSSYTSPGLGATVESWQWQSPGDWSGWGATFVADGVTLGMWHDARNPYRNPDEPLSSPFRGYLDDGDANQNYVHITGLADWMAATGHNEWRMVVLRSTDNASGFTPITVTTGDVAGESGWLNNSTPSGGSTATGTIAGVDFGVGGTHIYETEVFTGSANGVALHYLRSGVNRASVAGIVIQGVPDQGTTLVLLGTAILGLGGVRRKLRAR